MAARKKILAVGSSNVDVILRVPGIPARGESIVVTERIQNLGGKGSNRAVAMARLGADVSFCCKLGRDANSGFILDAYKNERLDASLILRDDNAGAGTAYIMLDDSGNNSILIYPDANERFTADDIAALEKILPDCAFLCIDLEFNLDAVEALLNAARRIGAPTVVDAGPVREIPLRWFEGVQILSPNETEAARLSGVEIIDMKSAKAACAKLLESGCRNVLLKWGANGALLYDGSEYSHFPAWEGAGAVKDTTAAGDCFTGALTCALAEGKPIGEAIRFANVAAAISITRLGALPSLPLRAEVDAAIS